MLDENSVKEGKVCDPKVWDGFNWDWFKSVPIWYLNMWSRLDLYRTAAALKEVPISSLKEEGVINGHVIWNAKDKILSGFGVNAPESPLEFDDQKRLIFGEDRHYYLFSDHKNYIFGVTNWTDGQQSWGVWSITKELSPEVKAKVVEHAKSLGFNVNFAIQTTYN